MKLFQSKTGFTYTVVALIVVALVIVIGVTLFIRLYQIVHDDGSRSLCNLEGVKDQVANVKSNSFWKTYELKCRAEDIYLTTQKLDAVKWTQALSDFAKAQNPPVTDVEQIKAEKLFSDKIKSCWQISGDNDIIQWKAISFPSIKEAQILDRKTFFYNKGLAASGSLDQDGMPLTACLVCSNIVYSNDVRFAPVDIKPMLQNQSFDAKNTVWDAISSHKPALKEILSSNVNMSVVYYQWSFTSSDTWSETQAFKSTRSQIPAQNGITIIPTSQIGKLCDVIVNQQ